METSKLYRRETHYLSQIQLITLDEASSAQKYRSGDAAGVQGLTVGEEPLSLFLAHTYIHKTSAAT